MITNILTYDEILNNKQFDIKNILSVDLQNKCKFLPKHTFINFINLQCVYNTKNILSIDYSVFDYCEKLSSFNIDDTVKYIGRNTFDNTGILSVYIPKEVTNIYTETFCECKNLKNVIFNKNSKLAEIHKNAFYRCESLTYIKLPKNIKILHECAFNKCKNLKTILIPKTIEVIKTNAFKCCENLQYVIFY